MIVEWITLYLLIGLIISTAAAIEDIGDEMKCSAGEFIASVILWPVILLILLLTR